MKSTFVASLTVYVVTAAWPRLAGAEQLHPISFDYPGATNTQATAITPSGDIAGRYTSPDGVLHGFLLSRGNFKSIDVPDSLSTDVT